MIQFNFQKISQVPEKFLIQKNKEIQKYLKDIRMFLDDSQIKPSLINNLTKIKDKNYNYPSFIKLPFFQNVFQKVSKQFKLIILIGIGGSNMGAQAVYKALENQKNLTEILFLDTLNPLFFKKILKKEKIGNFKKSEIAVCFISNSGTTFETIINFFTLQKFIKKYFPEIFIVTSEGSILEEFGKKKRIQVFTIPKQISSRYSIFSNIGLLPLYLCGVNIKELLLGAKEANEMFKSNFSKNPALISSLVIFYHWKFKKKNIYTNFVFPQELEFFGKWYCQLMAESLGKNGKGITPTTAVGTTDLHSLIQLYFDGPKDKLTNFIFIENLGKTDFLIPDLESFNKIFSNIKNKKMWQMTKTIYQGVKNIYIKKQIPFTEIILPKLDERNLGFLFQMKMIEIILLAKLMKINPFNQPAVELYKQETKNILKKL